MGNDTQDKDFLEYVVKNIVNHPENVVAERTVDERGVLLTLNINPEDMGYVIGKHGQTAKSIRTLLKINEPEGSTHVRRPMRDDIRRDDMPRREISREDISTEAVEDLKI